MKPACNFPILGMNTVLSPFWGVSNAADHSGMCGASPSKGLSTGAEGGLEMSEQPQEGWRLAQGCWQGMRKGNNDHSRARVKGACIFCPSFVNSEEAGLQRRCTLSLYASRTVGGTGDHLVFVGAVGNSCSQAHPGLHSLCVLCLCLPALLLPTSLPWWRDLVGPSASPCSFPFCTDACPLLPGNFAPGAIFFVCMFVSALSSGLHNILPDLLHNFLIGFLV